MSLLLGAAISIFQSGEWSKDQGTLCGVGFLQTQRGPEVPCSVHHVLQNIQNIQYMLLHKENAI